MKYSLLSMLLAFCLVMGAAQAGDAASLRKGATGNAVVELQMLLRDNGYLAGEADGVFGSTTEKALRLFQRDAALDVTGAADEHTLATLSQEKKQRPGGGVIFAPGNLGENIVTLQKMLHLTGYLDGGADGAYGPAVTTAVQRLQRDHGLEVIGAVDEATWAILERTCGAFAPARGLVKGLREKENVSAPKKREKNKAKVIVADKKGRDLKNPAVTKKKIGLREGDRGGGVLEVQRLLIQNGYNPGIADAHFGARTADALKKWQKAQGVKPTGIADEYFWQHADHFPPAPARYHRKWKMESSAYSSQDGDTGSRTACGSYLLYGHAAVDPDVIPLGSLLYIEGYGYAVADDVGGAIRHHKIDVAMPTRDDALQWGRHDVLVYLVELPE